MEIKEFQKIMKGSGTDRKRLEDWCRRCRQIKKQLPRVCEEYSRASGAAERVFGMLLEADRILALGKQAGEADGKALRTVLRDMKRLRGAVAHCFVVSPDDQEYFLTFDAVCRMAEEGNPFGEQRLLLKSEVENLMSLTKENLERPCPDPVMYAFWRLDRAEEELLELSPAERRERLREAFREGCLSPMVIPVQQTFRLPREEAEHLLYGLITA